jgi:hypothetical protein
MHADTILRQQGMRILIEQLGRVDAERFIMLVNSEKFDYTQWQQDLFDDVSLRQLSSMAMQAYNRNNSP